LTRLSLAIRTCLRRWARLRVICRPARSAAKLGYVSPAEFERRALSGPAYLCRSLLNPVSAIDGKGQFGKVGVWDAYFVLNRKVYAAIAASYLELADECARQLERKFDTEIGKSAE